MLLLDVPPEVFQRIIEIYVNTVGVRKAAKAREASSKHREMPSAWSLAKHGQKHSSYTSMKRYSQGSQSAS